MTLKNTVKHLNQITDKHFTSPKSEPLLICIEGNAGSGKTRSIKMFLAKKTTQSTLYLNIFNSDSIKPKLPDAASFKPEEAPDILIVDEASCVSQKKLEKVFAQLPEAWAGIVILLTQNLSHLAPVIINNPDAFPELVMLNINSKDALPRYSDIKK